MTDIQPGQLDTLKKGEKVGMDLQLYGGRLLPQTFGQVVSFSQMMCKAGVAIPKHLRENPGACMSVIQRSMAWEMDPWAVATKTYAVNDILAYEAQLIASVVKKWAPIKERIIPYVFEGEGDDMTCSIRVHHVETGEVAEYKSPKIRDIQPRNSPLWKSDRQQQLGYYTIRALTRRHFPEILLGVYDREEALAMKDITPDKPVENFLNDDPPGEVQEGEILLPTKSVTAADGKAGEEREATPTHSSSPVDPQLRADVTQAETFNHPGAFSEPEETVITPELIAGNMVKSISGFTDKVMLEEYQHTNQVAINGLPPELAKTVRKALSDRHIDLEEL